MTHNEKIEYLSTFIGPEAMEFINAFVNSHAKSTRDRETQALCTCIRLLDSSFTNKGNQALLVRNLIYIRSFFSQHHTFRTCVAKYYALINIVRHLAKQGVIKAEFPLPEGPKSIEDYESYKAEIIPKKVLKKFIITPRANDIFDEVLTNCCTPNIAIRLKEHVISFKHQKHHRAPLVQSLKQLSAAAPDWHKQPKIIQGELLRYRDNLLDKFDRNTAYGKFQNVKNAFLVLIKHQLLPKDTELPGNLRRCTQTAATRSENPVISDLNIYDEDKRQSFINSRSFINDYKNDIAKNLNILVTTAQDVVYNAYHQFLSKDEIIAKCQVEEFIKHPQLLIKNTSKGLKKLNPNYQACPLSFENRLAALDHFFDLVSNNLPLPKVNYLSSSKNLLGYLGLTPAVASAMQIIIVEELGINPYSLYNVKVSSNGHGHEFIQVTDEGSVRIRALKLRARKVRNNHAHGLNESLSAIESHEINASTCLKMALEMTSRARSSTNKQELWLCLTRNGAIAPKPETFQINFNILKEKVSTVNPALSAATLKKIRTSKGVLIYLKSNGDSLKAATYFGHGVRTTLSRYIPAYITELVYRVKIRSFQNILLFMSVARDESPSESLNLSSENFESKVKEAFNNPDMGGNLFQSFVKPNNAQEITDVKYFCVSEKNIALAMRYTLDGTEPELKNDCETVLAMLAEGPIILKQLLRKAQIAAQNNK